MTVRLSRFACVSESLDLEILAWVFCRSRVLGLLLYMAKEARRQQSPSSQEPRLTFTVHFYFHNRTPEERVEDYVEVYNILTCFLLPPKTLIPTTSHRCDFWKPSPAYIQPTQLAPPKGQQASSPPHLPSCTSPPLLSYQRLLPLPHLPPLEPPNTQYGRNQAVIAGSEENKSHLPATSPRRQTAAQSAQHQPTPPA